MQNLSLGRSKIFQTSKHLVISCSRSIAKLIFQKYDYFCLTASYICYRKFLYINNFVTPLTSYLLICFLLPYDRTRKTIKFELPSNMNTHIHHLKRERERERGGEGEREREGGLFQEILFYRAQSAEMNECKICTLQATENEIQRGVNIQKNVRADMAKTKIHLKKK